jgi:hypothetical protein
MSQGCLYVRVSSASPPRCQSEAPRLNNLLFVFSFLQYTLGWFTYSYCHGKYVKQFREASHSHPHPPGKRIRSLEVELFINELTNERTLAFFLSQVGGFQKKTLM